MPLIICYPEEIMVFKELNMKPEEVQAILATTTWDYVGEGTFNKTYVSKTPLTIDGHTVYWVKKIPKEHRSEFSKNERAVRKWNAIHPDTPAYAATEGVWVAPYFGNTPAPDALIADAVIQIYRRTRNLLIDACGKENFLLYKNEAKCVDVDIALRRGSVVSDSYCSRSLDSYLSGYARGGRPLTVSTIRTLLYLEEHLTPDEIKDEYITPAFIKRLHVLRRKGFPLTAATMEKLSDIVTFDTANEITDEFLPDFLKVDRLTSYPAVAGKLYAIHLAANLGLINLVRWLASQDKAHLEARGESNLTPLLAAVTGGYASIVEFLLSLHVKLDTKLELPATHEDYAMFHGRTALDIALRNRNEDIAGLLSAAGAIRGVEEDNLLYISPILSAMSPDAWRVRSDSGSTFGTMEPLMLLDAPASPRQAYQMHGLFAPPKVAPPGGTPIPDMPFLLGSTL